MKEIIIDGNSEKQTLLKYLRRLFPGSTDGFFFKMMRKKNIVLNGKKATGKEILKSGDTVKVFFSDETFEKLSSEGTDETKGVFQALLKASYPKPEIVYECPDFLAVNKAPGLLSQKAEGKDISINEMLLSYAAQKGLITEESYARFHPSVSNRLDRNTSGLLFFALTLKGQQFLTEMLKTRSLKKYYLALVHGRPAETPDAKAFLRKDEKTNTVTVRDRDFEGAREIHTGIEVLSSSTEFSLLKVHLITGAPHQIRAHLKFLGCPIIFDSKYGDAEKDRKIFFENKRQMLHSYETVLPDGRAFKAPVPADMAGLCRQFGIDTSSI